MKSKSSLRKAFPLFIALMMAFVLAACSGNNDGGSASPSASGSPGASESPDASPSTSAAPSEGPVTLKFATWIPADDNWNKLLALFNAEYPDIKVEMVNQSGTPLVTLLQQNIAAGEPIDIYWANSMWEPLSAGFVENLQPFVDRDPDFSNYPFLPGILESFKVGDDIYGLSRGNDIGLIYYNKDLLEKYGIDAPANNWTFTDMREMAKKATNAAEKTWGFNNTSYNIGWLASTVPYANGHTDNIMGLNAARDKIMWTGDNTAALDDLNYWYDITTKDQSLLNWSDSQAAGYPGGDLFEKGQALFRYDISYLIPGWSTNLNFKWDIAPIPGGTAKQGNYALNNPMFMASASKHKEAAWKFMKFWTTNKEFQKLLAEVGYTFPNSSDPDIQAHFSALPGYAYVNQDALNYAYNHAIYDPTMGMIGGNFAAEAAGFIADQAIEWKKSVYEELPANAEDKNKKIEQAKVQAEKVFQVQAEGSK